MASGNKLVLGVDLGVQSVGLALLDVATQKIVRSVARVFPAGVEGDFEAGRDESKNKKRRDARLARRQTERRARRSHAIFRLLQQQGLLPPGDPHECLKAFDLELSKRYPPHPGVPYALRAQALDRALESHELGRALYHLAQRRGFLSNRRVPVKDDEELGKVSGGIDELRRLMDAAGARTLGEYFAAVDPHETRIRSRYTHRKMYEAEFDALWNAQSGHHPEMLTNEFRQTLHRAMFFQRPLKDQSHLIGACSLVAQEKRAPAYELDAQRWRLLDKVNNLRLVEPERGLLPEERIKLLDALTTQGKLTYAAVRTKLLGLPKAQRFSIESGGEKEILGNVTFARFGSALNLRWDQMPRAEQDALVRLWASAPDDEAFRVALDATGQYSAEELEALCKVRLPDSFMNLSLAAMRRLLPHMELGMTFAEARKKEFPESLKAVDPLDLLPPVAEALPELRNPAVARALTELRKAVNEAIRKYGKPEEIRIELARDLKRNKKDRQAVTKKNRENEASREKARAALAAYPYPNPSRWIVEKYLLWEECGHVCPYSGRCISLQALLGGAEFEVEHIIPYSRSLDDSFQNKTLCARDYNVRKGPRTPWEAFGSTDEWDEMLLRVKKLGNRGKQRKFELDERDTAELLKQFSSNQLNDTRYMSRLAGKYLGLLYGGVADASNTQRIFVCAGGVTALLRRMWDLNRILSDSPDKSREDHRHHAVDAATVAVVTQGMIQKLGTAVRQAEESGQRRIKSFEEPWPGFRAQLEEQIKTRTVVSHRPERKLSGPLHEETLYGRPHEKDGKEYVHIRKQVHMLGAKDVENIVDAHVRDRVRLQIGVLAGEFKRLEHEPPTLESGVPIRRVRIRMVARTASIGKAGRQRNVITGDNHHMAVFAIQKKGKTTCVGDVVSRLEAVRRHAAGEAVVRKERGPDSEFVFTLSEGDMVRWKDGLWRVRGVAVESNGRLDLSPSTDARLKEDMKKSHALERPSANVFCTSGGRKVTVSPLGDVREARD